MFGYYERSKDHVPAKGKMLTSADAVKHGPVERPKPIRVCISIETAKTIAELADAGFAIPGSTLDETGENITALSAALDALDLAIKTAEEG